MEVRTYSPSDSTAFVQLLRKKYGTHKNFDYFLKDAETAYAFCRESEKCTFVPIALYEEGEMVAHIALIRDTRLPEGEAFFGFLESPHDEAVFTALWNALIEQARVNGVSLLKGPVSGSIWHQYRCISESDNSDFFIAEPISEGYYHELLISKSPTSEIGYYSAYRTEYDIVLKLLGAASYARLSPLGFSIKESSEVTLEQLRTVAEISKETFHASWGYTELTEKEFLQLYSPDKIRSHASRLYLLYKDNRIIGYCSTIQEDVTTLICKTICILPEFQGKGLGNALAYKVHLDAKKSGYTKIFYALIREGNGVKNFPKEKAVIFRKYSAFEFDLT